MTPTPTPLTVAMVTGAASAFIADWIVYVSAAFVVGLAMFTLRRLTRAGR